MVCLRSLLACAVVLVSLVTAEATVLPDPNVAADVLFNFSPPDRQSSNIFGSLSLSDSRFGFVSFTSSGTPSPSLAATANIGPNSTIPGIFGRAAGVLNYVFEILGPTGSVPVLINVAGFASAAAGPGASFAVASSWTLFDSISLSNVLAGDEIRSGQLTGSFNQSFNHTVGLTLTTNHIFAVFMLADAGAAATDVGSHAAADAFVDPIFSFGTGVDSSLYSFNFSPGIGNSLPVAGVPEPGTLVIFSSGLLLLVFVGRRRTVGFTVKSDSSLPVLPEASETP